MSKQPCSPVVLLLFLLSLVLSIKAEDVAASSSSMRDSIIFPREHGVVWRTLSSAIHLIGVSVLGACLARRLDKLSHRGLTAHALSRWLVILIFVDSWIFMMASGLLVSGIGLSLDQQSCTTGVIVCVAFYAISKILIYWFLAERIGLVHSSTASRLHSRPYQLCMLWVSGYFVIIILAVVGRVAFLRDGHSPQAAYDHLSAGTDGACVIGIGRVASTSLLVYDLLLNVFFTCMFLYPVYRSSRVSPKLKRVAKRTLTAAVVALITSAINICVLTVLHGRELGWMCLASCSADITVNALAIFFVTSAIDEPEEQSPDFAKGKGKAQESEPQSQSQGTRCPVMSAIRTVKRKVFPARNPLLPVTNVGVTSSTRGILESSTQTKVAAGNDIGTRSVHFSPHTTRGYEVDVEATPFSSVSVTPAEPFSVNDPPSRPPSVPLTAARAMLLPGRGIATPSPEPKFRSRRAQLGVAELSTGSSSSASGSEEALGRRLPTAVYLQLLDIPPFDEPEDTTLEIRQEGRISRNPRRRPPCLISMAVAHARKRSKSVDVDGGRGNKQTLSVDRRGSHVIRGFDDMSDPPASIEEARTRLRVLSTVMDIAAGRRDKRASASLLEVSVVTQTDLIVERRERRKRDLLDDYNGKRYDRGRGRSFSSSGGL